jgi:hypothetical protein
VTQSDSLLQDLAESRDLGSTGNLAGHEEVGTTSFSQSARVVQNV